MSRCAPNNKRLDRTVERHRVRAVPCAASVWTRNHAAAQLRR